MAESFAGPRCRCRNAGPNFAKTVAVCDYGPEGAFALVLNRPTTSCDTIVTSSSRRR